nr:MAG TPA: hypothetical protein [Caudoviricetes sp.]
MFSTSNWFERSRLVITISSSLTSSPVMLLSIKINS